RPTASPPSAPRSAPPPAASDPAPPKAARRGSRPPLRWIRPGTPPAPAPAPGARRCGIWRRRAGCRRTTGCRSPRWCWTARGDGSRTRSRRPAPATPPCRCSSARCTAAATASTRTSTRLKFGRRKHHDIDLQSGKLATNAQDTMLVTQIQMIPRKQANNHMLLER
uniref:Uncharacterized protein n=1 Tax=Oryza glaberrima TaxID=4538 RepID=I1PAF9_ORYGL